MRRRHRQRFPLDIRIFKNRLFRHVLQAKTHNHAMHGGLALGLVCP